ncbi:cyclophilin-like domain-containing protein [Pelagophyceae sp. CCMP2097]|nr:cyclophilin-like domain-containing protein [Pelagophyceae sp. CCMP2097]
MRRLLVLLLWSGRSAIAGESSSAGEADVVAEVASDSGISADIFAAAAAPARKRKRPEQKLAEETELEVEALHIAEELERAREAEALLNALAAEAPQADHEPPFQVEFAVQVKRQDARRFVVEVYPSWAPIGARRFGKLIDERFYDGNRFFRVLPGFVAQWGAHGTPARNAKWARSGKVLRDDPRNARTNDNYTVSFATTGPKSRGTQVFVNTGLNSQLNQIGFIPFARVISGADVVDALYGGYADRPDQERVLGEGNAYLKKQFPNLSYIIKTRRLSGADAIPKERKRPEPELEPWTAPPEEEEPEDEGEVEEM